MPPLITGRSLLLEARGLAVGAVLGLAVRACADGPSPPEVAAAAMTVALAGSVVVAACSSSPRPARAAVTAWEVAAAAGLAAGGDVGAVAAAALVAAGAAALADGGAALARRLGAAPGAASFAGAGLACAPAALIFVADPWIDWDGGTPESPRRAQAVLTVNPLAAMTTSRGGLGVDFQRMPWLYDGPAPGVGGLSLVGQYYPGTPATPLAWGGTALAAGFALAVLSALGRGREATDPPGSPPGAPGEPAPR